MIIGLLLAIGVGITLGLVGSGGSILTVPILVYVMGVNPVLATSYSLFTIGVTTIVGSVKGIKNKEVDFQKVLLFGIPSMITVYISRQFLLPLVPNVFHVMGYAIPQEDVLMVLFALVMLLSAYGMITRKKEDCEVAMGEKVTVSTSKIITQGALVGLVTGAVGAGGGFLIIPALINFFKLPMRRAASTSLVLIAMNSVLGLMGDLEKLPEIDWSLLLPYTGFTIVGIFAGFFFSHKINGNHLKLGFGYMIAVVSIIVLVNVLFLH